MLSLRVIAFWAISLLASMVWLGNIRVVAQEESQEEKQYREDYERFQKVSSIPEPVKRADQLLIFIKERPNSKLTQYALDNYHRILDGLLRQENNTALMVLSDRLIKARPGSGETYYFYGAALKNQSKFPESMDALAKCYVLKNPLSSRAKSALDSMYRARNQGSLAGLERIIQRAQDETNRLP